VNSIKPKQVIKFFRAEHAIDNLRNERLKVSKSEDFNDPFEILVADCSMPNTYEEFEYKIRFNTSFRNFFIEILLRREPSTSKNKLKNHIFKHLNKSTGKKYFEIFKEKEVEYAKTARNELDRKLRICCFSNLSFESSTLMWSHYADSHKGIVVAIDPNSIALTQDRNDFFQQIDYPRSKERVLVKYLEVENNSEQEKIRSSWKTKSKEWEYEKEIRWFIPVEQCIEEVHFDHNKQEEVKLWFKKINPQSIKSICFGLNCTEKDKGKIRKLVKENYSWIELFQADYHPREFALEINPYSY
jgi:hypothetical protein